MPFIRYSELDRIREEEYERGKRNAHIVAEAKPEPKNVGEALDFYNLPVEEFLKLPFTYRRHLDLLPGDVVTLHFDVKLPPR